MKFDPSLSLHDDGMQQEGMREELIALLGETAVCIASSYLGRNKKIYLMKLSVPKVYLS